MRRGLQQRKVTAVDPPAMTAAGGGEARLIQGGRWIVGDYWQDQLLLDGTSALRWELHRVAGWDPQARDARPQPTTTATPSRCAAGSRVTG